MIETGHQRGEGYYNDVGLFLTELVTESRWRIDGNGNVTQYEPVFFDVYRSSYVWPQTGNTDSYGYMPDETVARMTYEISFTDTVYGDVHYHALIHYLYGEGHFNVSEIKGPVGGAT